MFSVVPNIVLAPNMTQNTECKHRTQDATLLLSSLHPAYLSKDLGEIYIWKNL